MPVVTRPEFVHVAGAGDLVSLGGLLAYVEGLATPNAGTKRWYNLKQAHASVARLGEAMGADGRLLLLRRSSWLSRDGVAAWREAMDDVVGDGRYLDAAVQDRLHLVLRRLDGDACDADLLAAAAAEPRVRASASARGKTRRKRRKVLVPAEDEDEDEDDDEDDDEIDDDDHVAGDRRVPPRSVPPPHVHHQMALHAAAPPPPLGPPRRMPPRVVARLDNGVRSISMASLRAWPRIQDAKGRLSFGVAEMRASGISPVAFLLNNGFGPAEDLMLADEDVLWAAVAAVVAGRTAKAPAAPAVPSLAWADIVRLVSTSRRVVVIAGAGMAQAVKLRDVRNKPAMAYEADIVDPARVFCDETFIRDPAAFFAVAKHLIPRDGQPHLTHVFLRLLELRGQLQRLYTSNMDGLAAAVGIERRFECFGSFATFTCLTCGVASRAADVLGDAAQSQAPLCPRTPAGTRCNGVLKPDVLLYGDAEARARRDAAMAQLLAEDAAQASLVLVIGHSLAIPPLTADVLARFARPGVPIVAINRRRVAYPFPFHGLLLGDSEVVVERLARAMHVDKAMALGPAAAAAADSSARPDAPLRSLQGIHLFPGAVVPAA